jgi:FtsP/CotA-like multicopper oxidase with cupredoxin domain
METVEQDLELVFDLELGARRDRWTINGEKFSADREDIQVLGKTPTRLVLKNDSFFEHPFHLHGQFFEILSVDGREADEPGLKDTVLLEPESETVVYTGFENPGRWMVHCHILEHAELGMMVIMNVSDEQRGTNVGAN